MKHQISKQNLDSANRAGIEARGKVSTQIGELINDVAKVTTQEYTTRWVDSGYPIKIDVCYEESYQSVYGFGE